MDNIKLNKEAMTQALIDAKVAIDTLKTEIMEDEYDVDDSMCLSIGFRHILNCICRAWHYRLMKSDTIDSLTQEDYSSLVHLIPNCGDEFKLVDIGEVWKKRDTDKAPE